MQCRLQSFVWLINEHKIKVLVTKQSSEFCSQACNETVCFIQGILCHQRWNIFDLHQMRKRKKAYLSHYRYHRVKSDQIWSFFWSEYRKIRTRKNSNQKCLTNNALYKASIIPKEENSKTKIYYGVSERAFKLRYASHKKHSIQNYQTNIGIL